MRIIEKLRNNPVLSDLRNPELLAQLALDASFYVNTKNIAFVLELYSREFIVQIYRRRIARLKKTSKC